MEKDIHKETASMLFGVPEDQVTEDQRRIAMALDFGQTFGLSRGVPEMEIGSVEQHFVSHGVSFRYTSADESVDILNEDGSVYMTRVIVPFRALLDFVAQCYIKPTQIAKIEQMDTDGLLGTFVDDPESEGEEDGGIG